MSIRLIRLLLIIIRAFFYSLFDRFVLPQFRVISGLPNSFREVAVQRNFLLGSKLLVLHLEQLNDSLLIPIAYLTAGMPDFIEAPLTSIVNMDVTIGMSSFPFFHYPKVFTEQLAVETGEIEFLVQI